MNLGKRKIVLFRNRCRSVAVTVTSIPTVNSLVRFVAFQRGYYSVALVFSFNAQELFTHWWSAVRQRRRFVCILPLNAIVQLLRKKLRARLEDLTNYMLLSLLFELRETTLYTVIFTGIPVVAQS